MAILREKDFTKSIWEGGETKQLLISPPTATVGERNFDWRLSLASVQLEESTFTSFPGYQRILIPLTGSIILTHTTGVGQLVNHVGPMEVAYFEGKWNTTSQGKVSDFNLIFKEAIQPKVTPLRVDSDFDTESLLLFDYCCLVQGACVIAEQRVEEQLLLTELATDLSEITFCLGAQLILIKL